MESKELIGEAWFERVLRAYPPQGAKFLGTEPDPFRNPAGHTIRQALRTLLDELYQDMDRDRVTQALDSLMQIRAVQGVAPSLALEFLFQLKEIVRAQAGGADWDLMNGRIDDLALIAFDLYMKYRERTYEARANEARRRVFLLGRRLMADAPPAWPERGGR